MVDNESVCAPNKSEFDIIVDKHRNPEIWKSNLKNQWELINSI